MKNSGLFVSATKWKKGRNASRPKTTSATSPSPPGEREEAPTQPALAPAENAPVMTSSGATARS